MVSLGHWKGKLVRVCGCRFVWRRPENQRWDRKLMTEMNGEPWNTSPRQEEKLQIKDRKCIALKHLIKCGGQKESMACCEHAGSNLRDLKARTQDIGDSEVVQTKDQCKFERLTKKPTEQFEQSTVQSSTGGTATAAGRPAPEDSRMRVAAVAESATTESTTSSGIREMETEDQFNIECHKLLAGKFDRHGTIVDMDTCGAIVLTIDPEDRDGWTQQIVDRNKKCCGAKRGHLGHLIESQMLSEGQIKELKNIEKLEVAEIMLQEAIVQTTEIIYAGWLDDVARRTPEDITAGRSSEDATITASRIMLSMAAMKVTEKEQHHSTSDGWRSMTTWNEDETDKCWEEVKSILTGELDMGVPTTFVSENHGCVVVHRGTNFPSSGSDAESYETGCVRMAHSDTKIMPRIKPTWYGGEMKGKPNSCRGVRWSLQGSEWKSNSKHVDDMARLWRLKLESKETPTLVTKATERRRDTDETLMQHDVRASREAAGTSSSAMKSSIQKETWLCRRQADSKTLRACQKTLWAAEELTKEIVLSTVGEQACCDARPSRIRLTHRKSESHGTVGRLLEKASSWRVQVASLGSTQVSASERARVAPPRSEQWRERVAPPELMGESSRTVLTSKQTSQILEQIGTGAEARTTSGNSAICETCEGKQIENVANLTTEGSIQEARHKNETQLKSEVKILNRTPKQKHIRQSR